MTEAAGYCKGVAGVQDVVDTADAQAGSLRKEVAKYCGERGVKTG
jgi:indoleamine 2,3-dioxygenase